MNLITNALLSIVLVLMGATIGCATAATPEPTLTPAPTSVPSPAPLSLEALRNGVYDCPWPAQNEATLKDGIYEEELIPGSPARLVIRLHDVYAFGDLNNDGLDDAVVVLFATAGGDSIHFQMAAVINQGGTPHHGASADLGDRIRLESLEVASGQISVTYITHGPGDLMCCPTLLLKQTYSLKGDQLELLKSEPAPPLTPTPQPTALPPGPQTPLAETQWALVALGGGTSQVAVLPSTEITLRFGADGRASGSAGCNSFGGTFSLIDESLQFGPLAATKMFCTEPGRMEQETAYFAALGAARTYRVLMGQLLLMDEQGKQLLQFQTMLTANEPSERLITLIQPREGDRVSSPVAVSGAVTVSPFEATLTYRVYDASGALVGIGPIMVNAEMGSPGDFAGLVQFEVKKPGPGRIEIAELSANDGSVVVSTTVSVLIE